MEETKKTVCGGLGDVLTTFAQVIEFYAFLIGGAIAVHHLIVVGWIRLPIESKIIEAFPPYMLMVVALGSLLRLLARPFLYLPGRIFYAVDEAFSSK